MSDDSAAAPDPVATIRSRAYVKLLVFAAIFGLAVSFAAWGFLELVHQIQVGVFQHLPGDLGYHHGTPNWFYLVVLAIAGLLVAAAILLLPGRGGHVPADGLQPGVTEPSALPGVILAALATLGGGVVLGPEAPLLALGGGLGLFVVRRARGGAPQSAQMVVAATGSFACMSMIFNSPLIAAIILIEATGLGGPTLPVILLPGLIGAATGSLISIGMGSWTGLNTSAYSLGAVSLPHLARPDVAEFGWTIALAIAIAVVGFTIMRCAKTLQPVLEWRRWLTLPAGGLAIAGLAIAFSSSTDKGTGQVLFSGQDALGSLVSGAGSWSIKALVLLLVFKGLAWIVSLAGFRGGPTFPALFLGAAAGVLASHLPGFAPTAAVAVGMSAGLATILKLPLSAMVIGVLLTSSSGAGAAPLIVVGAVVAYVTRIALDGLKPPIGPAREAPAEPERPKPAAAEPGIAVRT